MHGVNFGPRMFRSLDNELMDGDSGGSFLDDEDLAEGATLPDPLDWCNEAEATLVTSRIADPFDPKGDWHMPVIDIDLPCAWVPSTDPSHGHLFINKSMTREDFLKLLAVMEEVGLVQTGYLRAARARGYSAVRMPGLQKPERIDTL